MDDSEARAARIGEALRGRTAKWLAGEVGCAASTALRYVHGVVPPADVALEIARVLGIDVAWYVSGRPSSVASAAPEGLCSVPQVDGNFAVVGAVEYPAGLVSGLGVDPSLLRCIMAPGEAMRPTVPRDAEVLFYPVVPDAVQDGRVYVVDARGRALVRRLRASPDGGWEAICDNPAFRKDAPWPVDPSAVAGECIWVSHAL